MPLARRGALAIALASLLAFAVTCQLTPEQLLCEEAASRLINCCPALADLALDCTTQGCHTDVGVTFSEPESNCILARSCTQLRAAGYCDDPFRAVCP